MYLDSKAWTISADLVQMLPLIQKFLDISSSSKMDLFKI